MMDNPVLLCLLLDRKFLFLIICGIVVLGSEDAALLGDWLVLTKEWAGIWKFPEWRCLRGTAQRLLIGRLSTKRIVTSAGLSSLPNRNTSWSGQGVLGQFS